MTGFFKHIKNEMSERPVIIDNNASVIIPAILSRNHSTKNYIYIYFFILFLFISQKT